MAITKTHPIKSTLKAAIDYICNPEKTDGTLRKNVEDLLNKERPTEQEKQQNNELE